MANRTRSKTGKGNGAQSSPGQYQTLLSYSKLNTKGRLKKKKNPEESNTHRTSTVGKNTEISEVKIKEGNINKTQLQETSNRDKEKDTNGKQKPESTTNTNNEYTKASEKANAITQSPMGKRHSTPTSTSNKKKKYFATITELLDTGSTKDKLPTLHQIVMNTALLTTNILDSQKKHTNESIINIQIGRASCRERV